ncbi:MAG: thioredoxin family protein [Planctomycetes bacterium]|nr:thioredoxin family protein [Planctomycetota bacterium]
MKTNIGVLSLALVIVFAAGSVSWAIGPGWTDNFEEAKAKAAAEDKDLLVDFTGSDWCGWCIKLNKEVFDKDTFKTQAPKDFVLVALDYPRDKSLVNEETTQQNARLKDEYAIRGYPTIYLMDETGRPYARTGYQAGGPETYMTHLVELKGKHQERDNNLAAAKKAPTDMARAESVDKALEAMGIELAAQFYGAEIEQIIALDADNKAGLKKKYEQLAFDTKIAGLMRTKKFDEAIELIQTQIKTKNLKGQALVDLELTTVRAHSMKGDSEIAIKTVDAVIKTHALKGKALQDALSIKAQVYQSSRDIESMKKVLIQAVQAAPDTPIGKSMKSYLDRMQAQETPKR